MEKEEEGVIQPYEIPNMLEFLSAQCLAMPARTVTLQFENYNILNNILSLRKSGDHLN